MFSYKHRPGTEGLTLHYAGRQWSSICTWPIAIHRALPVSSGAQTTDKHNSDCAISFFHIYLQITLSSINQIHDGKYQNSSTKYSTEQDIKTHM